MTVVPVMRAWLLWGDPPILVPEKHRKGNNERVVSLLMQMEDEERARLDESHRNALRQLADDKMLATADLVKMIESLKEWAARDERARTARDFLVDALTARISKERGAKR
jgi:benzoyl-CoA reductase/2-hydroxyglutaryl-CoA dehydratase subunit BcrC/BadD/HgdB